MDVPAETINFEASSKVRSKYIISSSGNMSKKPLVGFATKENSGEITKRLNKKLINVFVPTTPNPTSGFLLMFPEEDVIYLDLTFEEASKFIVSAGTSNPS